ncbi:MAG: beta-lactamase family protein [Alphaproteobacteria bacterium]|nr:beta-lactamase family protein [Alphaproteobacteria bacterium]
MTKRQISFISFSVIATVASLWLFVPWGIVKTRLMPLPGGVQEQVDYSAAHGLYGVTVYIQRSDRAPEFYASGWKDAVNKVPADPHALFEIASITKLYIATAVAKLADNGTLSLNDTLIDFFPKEAQRIEYADQITVAQMVQHRSGLRNFTDEPEFSWVGEAHPKPLEIIAGKPAEFAPGTGHHYSNTNYYLLARIIDQTLGYSHKAYISNTILKPLGLTNTYGSFHEVAPEKIASGYDVGSYPFDFKLINDCCMVATAEDVGIFLRALNDGTLFTASEQAIYASIYAYEHTGLLPGYSSIARYDKDIDTVVVLFSNTSGGKSWGMVEATYDRILQILRKRGA